MGADEVGTLRALKAARKDAVDPAIAAHGGRIVKTTGDGLLVEFPSVVDAVACAVTVQRKMLARNADTPEDKRIVFRAGINIGDIIIDGNDIFGDGVNIAARLESICEPGGLCISDIACDQVRDKLPLTFADRGEQQVKNIARPVRVFGLSPQAIAAAPELEIGHAAPAKSRKLALLAAALAVVGALGRRRRLVDHARRRAVANRRAAVERRFASLGRGAAAGLARGRQQGRLFRRRPHRGHHFRARALSRAGRALAQRRIRLQGQDADARASRPRSRRTLHRGGQHPPQPRAHPHFDQPHRRRAGHAALVGELRRRAERNLLGAGRHHAPHRRDARQPADRSGARQGEHQASEQSGSLRPRAARPRLVRARRPFRQFAGAHAVQARHRARPQLCARLCGSRPRRAQRGPARLDRRSGRGASSAPKASAKRRSASMRRAPARTSCSAPPISAMATTTARSTRCGARSSSTAAIPTPMPGWRGPRCGRATSMRRSRTSRPPSSSASI